MARTNRTPKKRRDWRPAFLAALVEHGNVSAAAKAVSVGRTSAYERYHAETDFRAAWDEAVEVACDALELEARRRAHEGLLRKKFLKNGTPLIDPATKKQYVEREYSDTLLMFLLKAHRPEKYRDNASVQIKGAGAGGSIPLDVSGSVQHDHRLDPAAFAAFMADVEALGVRGVPGDGGGQPLDPQGAGAAPAPAAVSPARPDA